jgi:23S rRNA pseudouridine1911/1915/1917 synthase
VAKTELALNRLAKQFFDRTTKRNYHAVVWGTFDPPEGTITGNIGRCIRDRLKMQVFPDGESGKPAITHYRMLEPLGYVSLIECRLETGRTHQIRVHMEHIRHPVFNDERYGGNQILRGTVFSKYRQFVENCFSLIPRHALHAKSLGFRHPESGKEMFFDSPLPADMQLLIEKWRNYVADRNESTGQVSS